MKNGGSNGKVFLLRPLLSLSLSACDCCLRLCVLTLLCGALLWRVGNSQGTGSVNGFINFAQPSLTVDEGPATQTFTTVSIPLVREGGTTGNVFATLSVSLLFECKLCADRETSQTGQPGLLNMHSHVKCACILALTVPI